LIKLPYLTGTVPPRRCSESDPNALLFIATDRISAYDVILTNVGVLLFFGAVLLGLLDLYTPVLEKVT
jgi:hypothetical protein